MTNPEKRGRSTAGPMPPSFVHLDVAVETVAKHLGISDLRARRLMLDAFCDSALEAWGCFEGSPPIQISQGNWLMLKYEDAQLPYAAIEVSTASLLRWLVPNSSTPTTAAGAGPDAAAGPVQLRVTTHRLTVSAAITTVYNAAEAGGFKPPNVNEVVPLVNRVLSRDGLEARRI